MCIHILITDHILIILTIKRLRKPSPSHLVLVALQHYGLDLSINGLDFFFSPRESNLEAFLVFLFGSQPSDLIKLG